MINETIKYHGVVFSQIVRHEEDILIKRYPTANNSSFVVNGVGLYIKYSTKRMSPWQFSFTEEHQSEIAQIKNEHKHVVVALVCGNDGVVALNYSELKNVLDENHEDIERITVRRPPRGKYRVTGTDGKLNNTIGRNEFPGKIFHLSESKEKNLIERMFG